MIKRFTSFLASSLCIAGAFSFCLSDAGSQPNSISGEAKLTVVTAPVITKQPSDFTIIETEDFTLSVDAAGN